MIDIANIESYDALVDNFGWDLPERFNIAHAVCGRHALEWADWPAIITSHEDCARVQDAYTLRCSPQVHGASRDAIRYCCNVIEIEMNSSTNNPLIFSDSVSSFMNIVCDSKILTGF